jgi:ubiquitin thioesterase protein OTUB1
VPLRVEYLFQEAGQDLYIGQDPQDDMPRSTCWPRHHHQVPPDHEVPRVTVLHTQEHYDIIYPYHPDGPVTSGESSGQRSDKTESQTTKSPSQHQTGSCSGETSNQQIDRVEGSTSTGEKSESDKHTAERES